MNREEALEHFKTNPNPWAASAYVTAGILTNADYAALHRLANPLPKAPKPKRVKWDITVDGRRGLQRRRKGQPVIEWIDPATPEWVDLQIATLRAI